VICGVSRVVGLLFACHAGPVQEHRGREGVPGHSGGPQPCSALPPHNGVPVPRGLGAALVCGPRSRTHPLRVRCPPADVSFCVGLSCASHRLFCSRRCLDWGAQRHGQPRALPATGTSRVAATQPNACTCLCVSELRRRGWGSTDSADSTGVSPPPGPDRTAVSWCLYGCGGT
jgi:hypothetical protein